MVVNTALSALPFSARITVPHGRVADQLRAMQIGTTRSGGALNLSLLEAAYALEKGMIAIKDTRRTLTIEAFERKVERLQPGFWVRSAVFRDLRSRGYIVKPGLQYGAEFTVYDRGVKPGEDHAKWLVFPVHDAARYTWHEFASKNRVAHTTHKRLLLGIVDDEAAVTYYEVRWLRP